MAPSTPEKGGKVQRRDLRIYVEVHVRGREEEQAHEDLGYMGRKLNEDEDGVCGQNAIQQREKPVQK